ncbi:MAG: lipopolysaccharide biosynthesis protein [Dehalococcoidia bacterium]
MPRWLASSSQFGVSRAGVALLVSSCGAAVLNLAFWVVAARHYPVEEVGRASAQLAAITLLAQIAQLNLTSVFTRFVPVAGSATPRFLGTGYAVSVAVAVVLGIGFLGFGFASNFLDLSLLHGVLFVLGVAFLAMFVVQDGVLTALQRAAWVPVENITVSAVKVGLLVALASSGWTMAVAVSWLGPVVVAVLVVSVVVIGRLALARARGADDASRLPTRRELGSFVLADHLNNIMNMAVAFVPPLLVVHILGDRENAYFTVPWLIASTLQLLFWNVANSYVVEAVGNPHSARSHVRQLLALMGAVAAAATVGLAGVGPWVLAVQGRDFASAGTTLVYFIAASTPFVGAIVIATALAVVRGHLWPVVWRNALASTILLVALVVLLPHGLWTVGAVFLAVQAALGLSMAPRAIRELRRLLSRSASGSERQAARLHAEQEIG